MKKIISFIILLSIAFSSNAQVLLETSFDTDVVADTVAWDAFIGSGNDTTINYYMKTENSFLEIYGYGVLLKKNLDINNYLAVSEMYAPTVAATEPIQSKSKCGIIFHAEDKGSCYYVVIEANSIGKDANAMIRLRRMVEGTQTVLLNHIDAGMPVAFDEKVKLGVRVEGSTFTFYLAKAGEEFGEPITSYTDPEATYTSGSVGLYLLNPSIAYFDNLTVTSVEVDEEAVATEPEGWVEGAGGSITNLAELRWLSETSTAWDENWVITNDIDASQSVKWNSGAGFSPIDTLRGAINGRGHTIKGLTINGTADIGFCNVIKTTITQLGLIDCKFYTTGVRAGIFGASMESGSISKCFATGEVKAETQIGGLVGFATGTASIEDCYASATVLKKNDKQDLGNAGGLLGTLSGSSYTVNNCYYVGKSRSPIVRNTGKVDEAKGIVTGCYYDSEASSLTLTDYVNQTALTTAEMGDTTSFVGWDFTNTWEIGENNYPSLKIFYNEPSGINTPRALEGLKFYPNPASGILSIESAQTASISILDMNGRTVITPSTITQQQEISIAALQSGIYFVKSVSTDGTAIKQLIVK